MNIKNIFAISLLLFFTGYVNSAKIPLVADLKKEVTTSDSLTNSDIPSPVSEIFSDEKILLPDSVAENPKSEDISIEKAKSSDPLVKESDSVELIKTEPNPVDAKFEIPPVEFVDEPHSAQVPLYPVGFKSTATEIVPENKAKDSLDFVPSTVESIKSVPIEKEILPESNVVKKSQAVTEEGNDSEKVIFNIGEENKHIGVPDPIHLVTKIVSEEKHCPSAVQDEIRLFTVNRSKNIFRTVEGELVRLEYLERNSSPRKENVWIKVAPLPFAAKGVVKDFTKSSLTVLKKISVPENRRVNSDLSVALERTAKKMENSDFYTRQKINFPQPQPQTEFFNFGDAEILCSFQDRLPGGKCYEHKPTSVY